ncbi:MAG: hypothetical protein ABR552_01545 [Actinomycetota bacterium]
MINPRAAASLGVASLVGATSLLVGSMDGSVVLVLVLVLAARAGALAASPQEPRAQLALARQSALVPAWAGVAIAAMVRAGSAQIPDLRGANAVAGLAIARGPVLLVVAAWAGVVAALLALIGSEVGASFGGLTAATGSAGVLEVLALVAQAAFVITLFAGPQIRGLSDIGPWIVGAAAVAEALWFGRRFGARAWVPRAATAFAVVAVACALAGGRL